MTPLEFMHELQIFNKGIAWMAEPIPKAFYRKLCLSVLEPRQYRTVERCLDWIEYELSNHPEDVSIASLMRALPDSNSMHTAIDNLIPGQSIELFEWLSADYHNQFYVNDAMEQEGGGLNIADMVSEGMRTMARDTYWTTLGLVEEMFNEYYEEEEDDDQV